MINDPFINTYELETELNSIRQAAEKLEIYFPLLSQKVAYIFTKIKECKNIKKACRFLYKLNFIAQL